jgi:transcriptional regulator with XRE-family HTH domain
MNNNEFHKKRIGSRIRVIRNELGLTMKEFGKRFDPPASDSIVSRWERGINLPNEERLKRVSELGDISMFYLTTGKKAIADLTDDEKKEAVQSVGDVFEQYNQIIKDDVKNDIKQLLDTELTFVETMYLDNMLRYLKMADTQDIIGISSIIVTLIRSVEYKNADDADKDELNKFLKNELDDITKFFHDYFFNDKKDGE